MRSAFNRSAIAAVTARGYRRENPPHGGSFAYYGCSNTGNRGTCDNRLIIRRDVLKASVLSGLKTHLMQPSSSKNSPRSITANSTVSTPRPKAAHAGMKDELLALEARKSELAAAVKQAPAPALRFHRQWPSSTATRWSGFMSHSVPK
jgi:hypothetical protein